MTSVFLLGVKPVKLRSGTVCTYVRLLARVERRRCLQGSESFVWVLLPLYIKIISCRICTGGAGE